jgi:hypothetical protein
MRMLTTAQLLDAWDELSTRTMPDRAAALVLLTNPELSSGDVAAMSLGRRDLRLLELRSALFGTAVNGLSACPACGETVETPFSLEDLLDGLDADRGDVSAHCEAGSWRVRYRAPTAGDASVLAASGVADARTLAARCVVEAHEDGAVVRPERVAAALPDAVVAAVAEGVTILDPAADLLLDVNCPACGHRWHPPFDALAFLWAELTTWARRTLRDVACLARGYGWREVDILAMSPRRRAQYLELLTT